MLGFASEDGKAGESGTGLDKVELLVSSLSLSLRGTWRSMLLGRFNGFGIRSVPRKLVVVLWRLSTVRSARSRSLLDLTRRSEVLTESPLGGKGEHVGKRE